MSVVAGIASKGLTIVVAQSAVGEELEESVTFRIALVLFQRLNVRQVEQLGEVVYSRLSSARETGLITGQERSRP